MAGKCIWYLKSKINPLKNLQERNWSLTNLLVVQLSLAYYKYIARYQTRGSCAVGLTYWTNFSFIFVPFFSSRGKKWQRQQQFKLSGLENVNPVQNKEAAWRGIGHSKHTKVS